MWFVFLLWWPLMLNGCSVNHKVMVGDEPVILRHTIGKGVVYLHLHQNETTALEAAQAVISKQGGSLITLAHSSGRTVVFHLHNQRYEFDPNRIYTEQGIKNTLIQLSNYTLAAHREVKKLADEIKSLLPKGKIITVHNNSTYSLKDYLPGHQLAQEAEVMYMSPHNYYRNFYLVTQVKDYRRLKKNNFNVVLQKKSATDDGSMSIFLTEGEYINVEAGYDQLNEQINMLLHA